MKKSILRRAITTIAATCLTLCAASTAIAQQGGTARHVYDGNGWPHTFTPRVRIFGAPANVAGVDFGVGAGRGREGDPASPPAEPSAQGFPGKTTGVSLFSAVSVQYGLDAPKTQTIAAAVSVDRGYSGRQGTPFDSVSVTNGPYVTSVSPTSIPRNYASMLTIRGSNLAGATAVYFINFAGVYVASLSSTPVSNDGTEIMAPVYVPLTDAVRPGTYVVVVATPAGDSLTTPDGGNLIEIR